MSTFSERINELINKKFGGKQRALASALNVTEASVSKWCSGTLPRDPTIRAIAQASNVSYAWLTTGEGDMDLPQPSGLPDALASLSAMALDDPDCIGVMLQALARLGPEYLKAAYDLAVQFRDECAAVQAEKKDGS